MAFESYLRAALEPLVWRFCLRVIDTTFTNKKLQYNNQLKNFCQLNNRESLTSTIVTLMKTSIERIWVTLSKLFDVLICVALIISLFTLSKILQRHFVESLHFNQLKTFSFKQFNRFIKIIYFRLLPAIQSDLIINLTLLPIKLFNIVMNLKSLPMYPSLSVTKNLLWALLKCEISAA